MMLSLRFFAVILFSVWLSTPKLFAHDEAGSGVLSDGEVAQAYFDLLQKQVVQAAAEAHLERLGISAKDLVRRTGDGTMGIPLRVPSSDNFQGF